MTSAYDKQLALHNQAMAHPIPGHEHALVTMLKGWEEYAKAHKPFPIGEDEVLGQHFRDIALAIRGLLNGEHGRLDAGTLSSRIRMVCSVNGITLP